MRIIGKSNTSKTSPIDTFSIVRILGRGSGGLVSLIENRNGERFTMKTVSKKKKAYNPENIRREIAAGLLLRHEGVAAAIRNWEDDDNVYLLMEELEGTDIVSLMESRGGVPFSEKVAKQIFKQLVGIVEHVHSRGIAHRAITLDNVMVDSKRRLDLSLPETGTVKLLQELSRQGTDPANNREIPTVMKEAQMKLKKEMKEEEKSVKNHLSEMKKLPSIHTAQKKKNGESSELDLYNILKSDPIRESIVELYYHGKWELRRLKLTKEFLIINFLSEEEKRSAKKTIDRTDSKQAKNFQASIKEEVGRREKNKKSSLTDSQETTLEENDTIILLSEITSILNRSCNKDAMQIEFDLNVFVIYMDGVQPTYLRTNSARETLQWILHIEGVKTLDHNSVIEPLIKDSLLSTLFQMEDTSGGRITGFGETWEYKSSGCLRLVDSPIKIEYMWNGRTLRPSKESLKLGLGTWDGYKAEWLYSSDSHVVYSYLHNHSTQEFQSNTQGLPSIKHSVGKMIVDGENEGLTHDREVPLPVVMLIMILKRMRDQYEKHSELAELLTDSDAILTESLCESISSSGTDPLAQSLATVLEKRNMTHRILKVFMQREVQNSNSSGTLFRANDCSSRIVRFYLKFVGFDWLQSMFSPILSRLIASNVDYEVDPHRIKAEDGSNLKQNMENLLKLTQEFFDKIVATFEECPPQILTLCAWVGSTVRTKFPEHCMMAMGGFFFLRYLCPALVQPAAFGLLDKNAPFPPNVHRALILSAKILQNLSNRVMFGDKEDYMHPANDFINANSQQLEDLFNRILQGPSDDPPSLDIPSDALIVSMEVLQNSISMHLSQIESRTSNHPDLMSKIREYQKGLLHIPPVNNKQMSRPSSASIRKLKSLPFRFQNLLKRVPSIEAPRLTHTSSIEDFSQIQVKLIEFGLCKTDDAAHCSDCVGSVEYLAPEMYTLKKSATYNGYTSDIWALGVVLYGILFGCFPISAAGYRSFNQGQGVTIEFPVEVSPEAKDLLNHLLQIEPSKRITIEELVQHEWLKN